MRNIEPTFLEFIRLVVVADIDDVARCLANNPTFATTSLDVGATRQEASTFFFTEIAHYIYAADTALHMAAAAFRREIAELLIANGANCRARNRRGAEPLHYAADTNHWNPTAQSEVISYLASVGANVNALDASGVAPLHRAVRTRSLSAVQALIEAGANPSQPNQAGSTPLHLAVQNTGRGGSGSQQARQQQTDIICFLLEHGAKPTDRDHRGKQVLQAATSEWIRTLLTKAG
ncbi:MAG: ankyrin repeat domain-containing protein [Undibacterium sp.]|nr:ankyrin repeat domain-containing protein [Undibacterium sp.]